MYNILASYLKLKLLINSMESLGPGVELLMNGKTEKTEKPQNNDESIEVLELELNDLTDSITATGDNGSKPVITEIKTDSLFDIKNEPVISTVSDSRLGEETLNSTVKIDDNITIIGEKTAEQETNTTWDGYKPYNEIPVEPTKSVDERMSKEELLREKFIYLRRLENLERRGIHLSKKYTIDSSLNEMKGEYEMIKTEKEKSNSVKFQAKMLMAFVTGVEFLNNRFDPFDVNLDGWGDSINENINDYDDVFTELHEKYKSKANIAPELKLLFMLGGSAVMCHMTNTMFKSAMPGMDDILKQNPELMQQFTGAAAESMQKQNTGFGNFMNDIMNDSNKSRSQPPSNMTPPSPPPPVRVPSNKPPPSARRGVSLQDMEEVVESKQISTKRPEMKGPSVNIDNILSEVKKKEGAGSKQNSINEIIFGGNKAERTPRKVNLDL